MTHRLAHTAFVLLALPVSACTPRASTAADARLRRADFAIVNARLVDGRRPVTVLLEGETILDVIDGPVGPLRPSARTIDARGGLVLPGFHDAHIHVLAGAIESTWMSLEPEASLEAMLAAVSDYASAHPDLPYIRGRGWTYDTVPGGRLPTRQMLDAAAPGRAIFIESYDGHGEWLSSAGLALAGITAATPDPPGGTVVRQADGKTPSGVLLEKAEALILPAVPPASRATKRAVIERALSHFVGLGITSLATVTDDDEAMSIYAELEAEGRLPVRVDVALPLGGDLGSYVELARRHRGDWLGFAYAKGYVDGVIEPRTAYMLEPYSGHTGGGELRTPRDELYRRVRAAHALGLAVGLHAVGDGAVRLALDIFERVQRELPGAAGPHRIEHIEVIDPADLPRFAALGVIASMQPLHATPEGSQPEACVWSRNVGLKRGRNSFAWRSLSQHGATLAFGSDWPVMTPDPLSGLALALTRRDRYGQPASGWNAHQTVDLATAVRAYSEGGARGVRRQAKVGRLQAGQLADLVVLNPSVRPEHATTLWPATTGPDWRIRAVIVGGKQVRGER